MIPLEIQAHDNLLELFTKLVGAAGMAPVVSGAIGPRELYENLTSCAPILRDTYVRPEDGLARVETPTFDMAWSIFSNGTDSVAIFILIRFEGNFAMQVLRNVMTPFKEMAAAAGLKSSIASQGQAEVDVVEALRGAQSVPMDHLMSEGNASAAAPSTSTYMAGGNASTELDSPVGGYPAPDTPPPPTYGSLPDYSASPPTAVAPPPASSRGRRTPVAPSLGGHLLTKGANIPLPGESVRAGVVVELGWFAQSDAVEIDCSAILLGTSGKVASDEDFVFFNNRQSPDGSVELASEQYTDAEGYQVTTVSVALARLRENVASIVFPASIYEPAERHHSFGLVPTAFARIVTQSTQQPVATFVMNNPPDATESALVFCEIYLRADTWKVRAIGQGYAAGLAGIATDYGVNVS